MIPKKLEARLSDYASQNSPRISRNAVGGLVAVTGAAVFSLPNRTNAEVVYTVTPNEVIHFNTAANPTNTVHINILAGSNGIGFKGYATPNNTFGGVKAIQGSLVTNGNAASHGVKKFAQGDTIGAAGPFKNAATASFHTLNHSTAIPGLPLLIKSHAEKVAGDFGSNSIAYAGFRLANDDLGYIQLEIGNDGEGTNPDFPDELTIIGYAYNDTPGAPVTAMAVPEPPAAASISAMLLLACGGAALKAWRKRRAAAALPATSST